MLLHKILSYALISLLFASIFLSIINTIQLCIFSSHCNIQTNKFLQSRKPILVIIYSILSVINSLVILPIIILTHLLQQQFIPFHINRLLSFKIRKYFIDNVWILTFCHEILTCLLVLIIAERAWLLLYNYKYIDAYTNIEWKDIINPQESKHNKWLKYKTTFGSHIFLSKVILFVFLLIISIFFVTQTIFNIIPNYSWIAIDIFFAFPLFVLILSIITFKIRSINDQFVIRKELQYLSIFIFILMLSFVIVGIKTYLNEDIFINTNIIIHISDILYSYCTVHIQCIWVIKQSIKYNKLTIHSPSLRRQNSQTLKLIDVLKSEFGFKAFINHSCKELNVENILFLIEIAQYKATLLTYDVGEQSIAHKFIDVFTDNLHKIVFDANVPASKPNNKTPKLVLNLLSDSLKPNETSSKQEDMFEEFQNNILSQQWLPTAKQLRPKNAAKANKSQFSISISFITMNNIAAERTNYINATKATNPDTPHLTVNNQTVIKTVQSKSGRSDSRSRSNSSITGTGTRSIVTVPPSIQLVRRDSEYQEEEDIISNTNASLGGFPVNVPPIAGKTKTRNKKYDEQNTVANEWIFVYAKYLFDKYIATSADLSVNLPSHVRLQLIQVFNTQMNDCFTNIWLSGGINNLLTVNERNILLSDKPYYRNLLIKTFLYHIFDISFKYIWALIRDDTFIRFQMTEEYNKIQPKIKRKKLRISPKPSPVVTPRYSPNHSPNGSFNIQFQNTPKIDEMNEINLNGMDIIGDANV